MTEPEWLDARDPVLLLGPLRGLTSERKLRLFACACLRRVWHVLDEQLGRSAVKVAERAADGELPRERLRYAWGAARKEARSLERRGGYGGRTPMLWAVASLCEEEGPDWLVRAVNGAAAPHATPWMEDLPEARAALMPLLRDVVGCPFRPQHALSPTLLAWGDGVIGRLAEAAYRERRLPSGELDPPRLAVLADALEEAGCTDSHLLAHLRGPGPHVRGCWALDLVLGKS